MGWFDDAWNWTSNAAGAVWDGAVEVGAQIAAPVVGGVTNGLQALGADVEVKWAEERLDKQLEVAGDVIGAVGDAGEAVYDFTAGTIATIGEEDKDHFQLHQENVYGKDENGKRVLLHAAGSIMRDEEGGYVYKDHYYERFEADVYGTDASGKMVKLFSAGDYKIEQYKEDVYGVDDKGQQVLLHKAGDYMENLVCNRVLTEDSATAQRMELADGFWDPVGNGIATGWDYTVEGVKYVGATVTAPVCALTQSMGLHDGTSDFAMGSYDRFINTWQPVRNFAEYAWENPGRATALATQGVVNGVTSLVGLGVDVVRNSVYEYTIRPTVAAIGNMGKGIYNLGIENPEDKAQYHNLLSGRKFFAATEWCTDTIRIEKLFDEGSLLENETLATAFGDIPAEIMGPDGTMIPNPNANYERVLLYGPQFITEAAVMVPLTAGSFGAAGGLWVGLRGTRMAAQGVQIAKTIGSVAQKVPGVTTLARGTGAVASRIPGAKPLVRALDRMDSARVVGSVDDLRDLDRARDAVEILENIDRLENASKWRFIGGNARRQQLIAREEKALERLFGSGNQFRSVGKHTKLIAKTETKLDDAKAALDRLKNGTGSADDIAKAEREVAALQEKLADLNKGFKPKADDLAYLCQRKGEKLARLTEELDDAKKALTTLRESGTASARQIARAERTVGKAEKAVKGAQEAYEKAIEPIEQLARRSGLEIPAEAAPRGMGSEPGDLQIMWETAKNSGHKGARVVDPRRSLKTEATIAGGVTGITMRSDQKRAQEEIDAGHALIEGTSDSFGKETNKEIDDMRRFFESQGRQQGGQAPSSGQGTTPQQGQGSGSQPSQGGGSGQGTGTKPPSGGTGTGGQQQGTGGEKKGRDEGNDDSQLRETLREIEERRPDLRQSFEQNDQTKGGISDSFDNRSGVNNEGSPLSIPSTFTIKVTAEEAEKLEESLRPIGGPK